MMDKTPDDAQLVSDVKNLVTYFKYFDIQARLNKSVKQLSGDAVKFGW